MLKKFYQRKWFIAVCVIIALGVIGSMMNNDKENTQQEAPPKVESAPVEEMDITE